MKIPCPTPGCPSWATVYEAERGVKDEHEDYRRFLTRCPACGKLGEYWRRDKDGAVFVLTEMQSLLSHARQQKGSYMDLARALNRKS